MAGVRQLKTGKWEVSFTNAKLLEKRVTKNFDHEEEARAYAKQGDELLALGIVPEGFNPPTGPVVQVPREAVGRIVREWLNSGHAAQSDQDVLSKVFDEEGAVLVRDINYRWCEAWVRRLKVERNLSPGTIRKRVGALSRAMDHWARQYPEMGVVNHLASLPRGYSMYSAVDTALVEAKGFKPKIDEVRDRRLAPGEDERIVAALSGAKRADRERALNLPEGRAMLTLFLLILHTGVRLVEAYTLTRGQIDLARNVVRVKTSKQHRGKVAFRDVPIRPELKGPLVAWLDANALTDDKAMARALVFPFWDGHPDTLMQVSNKLSQRFRATFDYAQCENLLEHDLRHEATCRWYELRDATGHWMFRDAEIMKIMGWSPNSKMAQRYASFRGEDLAARLWSGAVA